jgi:hypothetical protein
MGGKYDGCHFLMKNTSGKIESAYWSARVTHASLQPYTAGSRYCTLNQGIAFQVCERE